MEKLLWYEKPAEYFEEALPLGNGKIGAMVYGQVGTEKINLNADSLWTGYPHKRINHEAHDTYSEMKRLFKEGKTEKAQELIEKKFVGEEAQAYLPAGDLIIKTNHKKSEAYMRKLDLEYALAESEYVCDNGKIKNETFISAVDEVLVHSIKCESENDFEISLESGIKNEIFNEDGIIVMCGVAPDKRVFDPNDFTYKRDDTVKYTVCVKPVTDGSICVKDKKTIIENAKEVVLYLSIKTSYNGWDKLPDKPHKEIAKKAVSEAANKGYENVKNDHIKDFSSYFNRVDINISNEESIPTDKRIQSDVKTAGTVELLFNFGRYLIISSSRKGSLATNLQGIWNKELIAPWASDYTTNINTQMNYWPVLMCNLSEFMSPLTELIKMAWESGKETAREYYNINDGFVGHHNYDIWGKTDPAPGSTRWAYWCMSSGWLCRHLFEYYEYTNDLDFLENTAFPIILDAAKFYMEMLEEDAGKLIISPSTSPENAYMLDGKTLFLSKYTTMTQAILQDLFANLKRTCKILKKDELLKELEKEYPDEKFNVYQMGSKGQLLEYDKEYEEEDIHHRHVSHLYGLYPGESIRSKELLEAAKRTLEIRSDDGTGWSLGWKVNLWTKLKDGDHALKIVKNQLKYVKASKEIWYTGGGGTYLNMFDAHPPFQIDGNFGVAAGIAQMFLQSENGIIDILPALPNEFENGYITGLLAKGNINVGIWWSNKEVTKLTMSSPFAQEVKYRIKNGNVLKISLEANKECVII